MAKRKAVSSEVTGKNNVPFKVTPEKPFNIAALESVSVNYRTNDEGEKIPSLVFVFIDKDAERTHIHYENVIDGDIGKLTEEKRISAQDAHLAHMYNQFMGDGAHVTAGPNNTTLGSVINKEKEVIEAEYDQFFESVAKSFNTGRNKKEVFKDKDGKLIPFWLKLTYSPNGQLQIPLFNNFMDRYREGHDCLLTINPQYDRVQQPSANSISVPATNVAASVVKPKGFDF
jgi:hypothetical protein